MEDRDLFIKIMATLWATLPNGGRELDKLVTEVYWTVLKPYDDETVNAACNQLLRTAKWVPTPAEILEVIEGPVESRASEAWTLLQAAVAHIGSYRSVIFDDKAIMGVISAWGGWLEVCQLTNDDMRYKAREFKELYNSYKTKPVEIRYLIGRTEADNILTGYPEHVPEPVRIGLKNGQVYIEGKDQPPRLLVKGESGDVEEQAITPADWEALHGLTGPKDFRLQNPYGQSDRERKKVD